MKDFDLDKLPRRMPYHLPDGSLEAIEQEVQRRIAEETAQTVPVLRQYHRWWRIALPTAVVAAIASFVWLGPRTTAPQTYGEAEIAQAFEGLSDEDQAFILDVYEEYDDMQSWE